MGTSNADRQRAYRERRADEGSQRLDIVVSANVARALECLARHRGKTRRAVLESLMTAAEREVIDLLDYLDGRRSYCA